MTTQTHESSPPLAGPLDAILRQHGATMVARDGRWVAAHFGSATSETAVCVSTVGLADRFDRTTLELRGNPADVETALELAAASAEDVGCVQVTPRDAIARCNHARTDACIATLLSTDVAIEITERYAAIEVIGPRAAELIRAAILELPDQVVIAIEHDTDTYELLIERDNGPYLWNCLLTVGTAVSIACVGLDALTHLAAARHVTRPHARR
jgi:glycine cleavage system aminomethyltransferase T